MKIFWRGNLAFGVFVFVLFFHGLFQPQTAYAGAPTITSQPQSQSIPAGSNATFSVVAAGTAPLSYQWALNGTNLTNSAHIIGATSTTLTVSNLVANDSGNYYVVVSNSHGSATSSNATLTVLVPPTITGQPQSLTTNGGSTVTLSATVSGSSPLFYQWQFNGTNLSGATNATVTLSNVLDSQSGSYDLVVSNTWGGATSSNATLTVIPWVTAVISPNPIIEGTGQLLIWQLNEGGFSPNATYQWYQNGNNLGSFWDFTAVTEVAEWRDPPASVAGTYFIVGSDSLTSATSSVVTLTVLIPAKITTPPTDQSVAVSNNAVFSAGVIGDAPINYQWYFNNAPLTDGGRISGSTTTTLNIASVQTNDAGSYQLIVSNNYGSGSATATLTVLIPPAITSQPTNQSVGLGSNVTFMAAASGTSPLNYQWFFNTNALADGGQFSGTATPNLAISNLQLTNAGNYTLVVTNLAGSVTSAVATLTVISPPMFTSAPLTNQVTMVYSNVTLSVTANGTPPLTYQWSKDGINLTNGPSITGANSSNLTVLNPQLSDSGQYTVTVSNAYGTIATSETLTVVPVLSWGEAVTTPPATVTNVMAIASAGTVLAADFAIRADGSIVGWGSDFYGILDIPSNATNLLTITAGPEQAIAVRPDGSVVSWGYGGTVVPAYVTNVVAAAVESYGGCLALRQDGTVVTWNGATTPPASATNVIAIGAGFYQCLAVRQDGTIVGWGDNSSGEISPPASATNVIAVGGGAFGAYTYSMALRTDGNVVSFGLAPSIPPDATNLIAIAPGDSHWLGLKQDGTAFDSGLAGQSPSPSNCVAIAASGDGYQDRK